jgi:hypothetical protein
MLLVFKYIFRKNFNGIALWPFIIVRYKELKNDMVFLNHERIHLRQQIEMLVVFFYVWYALEFLIRLIQYKNRYKAYRNIGFEREAYTNEGRPKYLSQRSFWRFFKYL